MHRALTFKHAPGRHRAKPRRLWVPVACLAALNTLTACSIPLLTLKG